MSIECLNKALKIEFDGQTPTKRLILILLANYCDDNDSCYPSYKHIAKLAGLKDTKHIANIIKEFEELGLLRIENRRNEDGGNTSNRYHLTLGSTQSPPVGLRTTTPLVPTPDNTKEDTKENIYRTFLVDSFGTFWDHYPRKVAKDNARKSYEKLMRSLRKKHSKKEHQVFADQLAQSSKNYAAYVKAEKVEDQFVLHGSTYLNQRRFEDYQNVKIRKKSLNAIAG